LAIMVGGHASVLDAAMPILSVLGKPTHLGTVGSGQLAKLANQVIVGGTLVAIAEALELARRGGADPAAVREALMGGFGDSKVLRVLGERMVRADFAPGSPASYQLKDMKAAAAFAGDLGFRLGLLDAVIEMFECLEANGEGMRDVAIIAREVARRAALPRA
jgi:3-hydroxyisobutyrate dehydrogenase-like beta-hydroxyacid dehydrogenase